MPRLETLVGLVELEPARSQKRKILLNSMCAVHSNSEV